MPASRTKAVVLWAFIYCSSLSSTCLAAAQSTSSSSSEEGDSSMLHEDSRCLCKCPDVSTIRTQREADLEEEGWLEPLPVTDGRSIYLNASVGPNECDCAHVVLIHLNLTETQVVHYPGFFRHFSAVETNSTQVCAFCLSFLGNFPEFFWEIS